MATTKKVKSTSGIDRKISAARKALAKIRSLSSEKKRLSKKERTLKSLQNKLKTAKKRK